MIPDSVFQVIGKYFCYCGSILLGALLLTLIAFIINKLVCKSMDIYNNWQLLCALKKELLLRKSA